MNYKIKMNLKKLKASKIYFPRKLSVHVEAESKLSKKGKCF